MRPKGNRPRCARGFTLVEMALIVVIVGMIAAAILPRVMKNLQRDLVKTEKTSLRAARDEVVGAVLSVNCTFPAAAGLERLTDKYGGAMTYALAPDLTAGDSVSGTNSTGWDMDTDGDGTKDINNVAFFLYSVGKDRTDDFTPVASFPSGTLVTLPGWGEETTDDIIDYVTLTYLQTLCNGTETSSSPKTKIQFDTTDMQTNFADPVSYTASGAATSAVTVNDDGTITLGADVDNEFGCIWYTGNNDLCTNGNCTFGTGYRAFFQFQFNSTGNNVADGFTFATASAEANNGAACGGIASGGSMGELLGYAGPGASGHGIQPPKFAIEFDVWENSGTGTECNVGNRADPGQGADRDHVGFLWWGQDWSTCSPTSTTWDDNKHGNGIGGYTNAPVNQADDDNDGDGEDGFFNANGELILYNNYYTPRTDTGSGQGPRYLVRLEVLRNETATVDGRYKYDLKAWIARDQTVFSDFYDTDNDYTTESPTIVDTVELTAAYHDLFDKVLVGWTEGTGGENQQLTLLKFDLTFRE